jgi:hypothetical protein
MEALVLLRLFSAQKQRTALGLAHDLANCRALLKMTTTGAHQASQRLISDVPKVILLSNLQKSYAALN